MGMRRVQKVGKSTYTVSLPHEWVKKNKIAPKTEVSIVTLPNGSLRISTVESSREEKKPSEILIEAKEPDAGYIIRKALAAYIANYDLITIDMSEVSFEPNARDKIRKIIKFKMAGAEIIEETSDHITIQILLKPYEFPLNKLLLRMSTMARDMIADTIKAMRAPDLEFRKNLLSDIVERDEDVDKLYFMGSRWLSNIMEDQSALKDYGLNDLRSALEYKLVFRNLERIADHTVRVSSKFMELDASEGGVVEEILQQLNMASEIFVRAIVSFSNGSLQEANSAIHEARKLTAMEGELISRIMSQEASAKSAGSLMMIMDSIRRIVEYGIGISELVFNAYIGMEKGKQS